jgi:hypothetical protein
MVTTIAKPACRKMHQLILNLSNCRGLVWIEIKRFEIGFQTKYGNY